MTSLLEKIRRVAGQEAANVFQDAGLYDDEDISQLCYESLKELFPEKGAKTLLLKSKIWKIVSSPPSVELSDNSSFGSVSSRTTSPSCVERFGVSPSVTPPPGRSSPATQTNLTKTLRLNSPEYTIYKDNDLVKAAESGSIPQELRHRLIRATISNMTAAAFSHPFNRMPSNSEVKEMAKSLILTYPCLSESENDDDLLCKQLQKRLYNTKKSGSTKKKNVNGSTAIGETPCKKPKLSDSSSDFTDDFAPISDHDESYCEDVMERHYASMMKEHNKSKPNWSIINMYLNKEFESRRNWICSTASHSNTRCQKLFEKYPCFKNHVEIIEEVRRCLQLPCDAGDTSTFLRTCVKHLETNIEYIMFYGIVKKELKNILSPSLNAKIIHVMQNIAVIFPSKQGKPAKKNAIDVVYTIKDHEDPELWVAQRRGEAPVILLDSNYANLIVGRQIVSTVERKHLREAVLAYLGLYYLLDLDYPASLELGFTVLQYLFFKDQKIPGDMVQTFNATLTDFKKFQESSE